jgi:hypothetical protein
VSYSYDRRMKEAAIPSRVDLTRWSPSEDRRGRPVAPGDMVSVPKYPRGTVRGVLRLSDKKWAVTRDGEVGALVVETEDGTLYEATAKILKL